MAAHEWVEANINRRLTDFQRRAIDLLIAGLNTGPWNVPVKWERVDWSFGGGVRFTLRRGSLATFDFDHLTRLVILAHDRCIRVSVEPRSFQYLAICMWPRKEAGALHDRHPTIEEAIERLRADHPSERKAA